MSERIEKSGQEPVGSGAVLAGVKYFCVINPEGLPVHTTVSLRPEEAISQWIETEQACNIIVNAGRSIRGERPRCSPSWEQFEAEGYTVKPVKLEVINANNS